MASGGTQIGFLTRNLRPELNFVATKAKDVIRNMKPEVSYCRDLKIQDIKILKMHL